MKPLNGSWLFNVDFEEIDTALTYAKFEKNKVTKQPDLESVIKNKFLQEITMKTKLKIGDKVKISKPKVTAGTCWVEGMGMEYYIGMVSRIKCIRCENADLEDIALVFPLSSLTLVEEATEQATEQVTKEIDWEQRRWELVCSILVTDFDIPIADGIEYADTIIKHYKQTLK